MESKVIDKKEIELGDRKVEVRLVECNVNQHGYSGQRIYSRFIDKPKEKVTFDKSNNTIAIGQKPLTDDQVKMLKRVINNDYQDSQNVQEAKG